MFFYLQHNLQQNNMYTNHQRIPQHPTNDNNWQQHTGVQHGMGYVNQPPQQQHNTNLNQQYPIPNENVYANLGSQPPLAPNMHHQDNSSLNYERYFSFLLFCKLLIKPIFSNYELTI